MTALVVLNTVVVALLALLVVGLLRSHAEILRRLHELGADVYDDHASPRTAGGSVAGATAAGATAAGATGGIAHDVVGTTPQGGSRAVRVAGAPHATLLAFLTTGCGTCGHFWEAFASGEAERLPGADTRLVIVTKGPEQESPGEVNTLAPHSVITIMSSQAFEDYGVQVSPYFILVDGPAGVVIGEGAAASWPQVRHLLAQAVADGGGEGTGRSHDAAAREHARESGRVREARADADLLAAGITPGHPSLYPGAGAGVAPGDADHGHEHPHDHQHPHDHPRDHGDGDLDGGGGAGAGTGGERR